MDGDDVQMDSSPTSTTSLLKTALQELKSQTDELHNMLRDPSRMDEVPKFFNDHVIPPLLNIRPHNRAEKIEIENRAKKVKEVYRELRTIQDACASLEFEVACLRTDVNLDLNPTTPYKNPKNEVMTNGITKGEIETNSFDVISVAKNDHPIRMRMLDEEQELRLQLKQKLSQLQDDLLTIEKTSTINAKQLDSVKPHIKNLLDKIGPIVQMTDFKLERDQIMNDE